MNPDNGLHVKFRAALALAHEDPHTEWVMKLFEWTILPFLILCLTPSIKFAWKSENFRDLGRSIQWGWAGLFVCYLVLGLIAPIIVSSWTGHDILGAAAPSTSVVPMALFGWFPGAIISFLVCSLGILWRGLRGFITKQT